MAVAAFSEEIMFRGIPIFVFGVNVLILLLFNAMWSFLHLFNDRNKAFTSASILGLFISGIFYIKLWLGGLYLHAVIIHFVHNLMSCTLYYASKKITS